MAGKLKLTSPTGMKRVSDIVKSKASQLAPTHLGGGITVTIEKNPKGDDTIKLHIDKRKYPDARAWEYGSGVHSRGNFVSKHQLGPKGEIRITGRPFLAFSWEVADRETLKWSRIAHWNKQRAGEIGGLPSYAGEAPDGNLLFNWVNHPGIQAANSGRGYMRLAVKESIPQISKVISKDATEQLAKHIRAVFSRPGGKNK